ncbi:FkbM family methyltransferase [Candidatus Pseudothioglobus singularis]|jgi:FkbM family methyltransferase|nr:FkbM family methyltransferase [Candidatus Pseudothioglobus singularis]
MTQYISKFLSRVVNKLNYLNGLGYGGQGSIKQEVKLIQKVLEKSSPKIFIDAGANIGLYTDHLLNHFKNIEVHIFEPSQVNIKILNNKFKNKNVIVNSVGLSNLNDNVELFYDKPGSRISSLTKRRLNHFNIDFNQAEQVKVIRFIDYYNKNFKGQTIDFLKLDIEGHELDALEGCGEIINNIKYIQIEFGGCNIDTKTYFQDFWYFFKNKGFDIFRISPIGLIEIDRYQEQHEYFRTTNYICVSPNFK